MLTEIVRGNSHHVLKLLLTIGMSTVMGYIGILFLSPFVAAGLAQAAYMIARTRRGGTPLSSMKQPGSLSAEATLEGVMNRKLDTNLTLLKKVVQESASYTSVLTAVLLQLAQPGVGKGAGRHSTFSSRHAERTLNTAIYINVIAFGTEAEKIAFRNFVTTAHKHVNDNKTKKSYDAMDPRLQLWIAAVTYVTMMDKYEAIVRPFSEAERDQVYQQFSIFPTALQVPLSMWPENRQAFQLYWDKEIAGLRPPKEAIRIAQGLLHPTYANLSPALAIIVFFRHSLDTTIATEELPEHICQRYGLKSTWWSRARYSALIAFYKLTYPLYPEPVRTWQRDYYLWVMRQRFAKEERARNGKSPLEA
ncbi:DUF2236 domain-containing protein [Histoplasma capsulatum]|uniref:DUF2236 domain-containing protein n=1 Tax=Ajellomyces capsulatus TaxID=5037 RepID=A0A8A1MCI3_AJECA|nr:predicted protein [Histoplasma mississippiense (nom. inval.)]EDN10587.1 predicted protein [Histoplasma mississippiense (nom. inval.)]QSS64298.1 DUF2236 domain-containing protein [Histoplasma capsulatum]